MTKHDKGVQRLGAHLCQALTTASILGRAQLDGAEAGGGGQQQRRRRRQLQQRLEVLAGVHWAVPEVHNLQGTSGV